MKRPTEWNNNKKKTERIMVELTLARSNFVVICLVTVIDITATFSHAIKAFEWLKQKQANYFSIKYITIRIRFFAHTQTQCEYYFHALLWFKLHFSSYIHTLFAFVRSRNFAFCTRMPFLIIVGKLYRCIRLGVTVLCLTAPQLHIIFRWIW